MKVYYYTRNKVVAQKVITQETKLLHNKLLLEVLFRFVVGFQFCGCINMAQENSTSEKLPDKQILSLYRLGWTMISPNYVITNENAQKTAGYLYLKFSPECGKFSGDNWRRVPHVEIPPTKVLITNASFPNYMNNWKKIRINDDSIAAQHCVLGKFMCLLFCSFLYFLHFS